MRDVAQRSGVALATVYRYFRSKEHLLAAALEDWQKRLTRRILAARSSTDEGPLPGILDYLQRAQRAFHRNPNMTALMLQAMTSADPEAKAAIDHMNRTNVEMFNRLLEGVAEDGTIEAIRIADAPGFALGVQWHAEYDPQRNPINRALFTAFGEALAARRELTGVGR